MTDSKSAALESEGACETTLRADAQRNRELILAAAREVFAERGLDASLNEVARRAGVGVATLFGRSPTRHELIAATFADGMNHYSTLVEAALADPDPWHGFCDYVRAICAIQARDRGFADVLTQSFPTGKALEAQRDQTFGRFTQLIERAQKAGALRADFVPEDLPMLLMANAGVVAATAGSAPRTSPRLVAYLLQAFDARATDALPDPPSPPHHPAPCSGPSSECKQPNTKARHGTCSARPHPTRRGSRQLST